MQEVSDPPIEHDIDIYRWDFLVIAPDAKVDTAPAVITAKYMNLTFACSQIGESAEVTAPPVLQRYHPGQINPASYRRIRPWATPRDVIAMWLDSSVIPLKRSSLTVERNRLAARGLKLTLVSHGVVAWERSAFVL